MTKQMIACLCSLLVLSISCKKDSTSTDNTNPTEPVLLRKFIALNPSVAAPDDTVFIVSYSYDNLNRCTHDKLTYYPDLETFQNYNYYNGTDTLISKRTILNSVPGDTARETIVYSASGEMLFDSTFSINNSSIGTLVFNYELDNSEMRSTAIVNNQPYFINNYQIQKDQNGNILSEKDSIFMYTAGSGFGFWKYHTYTKTFDNHPCPLYKLYPKRPFSYEAPKVYHDFFYDGALQKNNILSEVSNNSIPTSPTIITSHSYSYTYLSNGYPATVIITNDITGQVNKGVFVY